MDIRPLVSFPTLLLLGVEFLFCQIYPFRHYAISDGLVQSSVVSIFQDSRGYLWFGTLGGASRYDGWKFESFLSEGRNRSIVHRFLEDDAGTIWAATEGNGIAVIDPRGGATRWMTRDSGDLPSDSVFTMIRDHKGNLWVGTRHGVSVHLVDGRRLTIDRRNGLPANWIHALLVDRSGAIWAATSRGTATIKLTETGEPQISLILNQRTLALYERRDGSILMATDEGRAEEGKGVYRFSPERAITRLPFDRFEGLLKVQALFEDTHETLWIGTGAHGIFRLREGTSEHLTTTNGLISNNVAVFFQDHEGSMWLGSPNGISKLPQTHFLRFPDQITVRAIAIDNQGHIWHNGHTGLWSMSGTRWREEIDRTRESPRVLSIVQDKKGRIWFGTNKGLGTFRRGRFDPVISTGDDYQRYFSTVLVDSGGMIWGANSAGEIMALRDDRVTLHYGRNNGIPAIGISALAFDNDGVLWFGTEGMGAGSLRNDSAFVFTVDDGLPHPMVESILCDSKGRLWFATRGGVAYRTADSFRLLEEPVLANSPVFFAFEARNGHMWFGTWSGLFEWADSLIARYDTHDGLSSDIVYCATEDQTGNLWFGTASGLSVLGIRERSFSVPTPLVNIERVQSDNEVKPILYSAPIPYDERTIAFRVVVPSYVDERTIVVQHMLRGFDDQWGTASSNRLIRYTTLPAGDYALRVRAANRNGRWSEPAEYRFEILPPFWETWWFRLGAVLVIGVVLAIVYRYRVNRLLELERLRLRIAGDLHDEIGSYLGGIALQGEMVLKKSPLDEEGRSRIRTVVGLAHRTAQSIRDLVWLINPEHDTLGTLVAKMKTVADQTLGETKISFEAPEEEHERRLEIEFKRNLFLIYREALHNIQRHARATEVAIRLLLERELIVLEIEDNGVGLDAKDTGGHGIRSMRDRASTMQATLWFDSKGGKGTLIRLEARIP